MSSQEFVSLVKMNEKYDYFVKDTGFKVFKTNQIPEFEYICKVFVDKTTIKYDGDHPSDLLVGDNYIFIKVENEEA